jgi:hypothetical protein
VGPAPSTPDDISTAENGNETNRINQLQGAETIETPETLPKEQPIDEVNGASDDSNRA